MFKIHFQVSKRQPQHHDAEQSGDLDRRSLQRGHQAGVGRLPDRLQRQEVHHQRRRFVAIQSLNQSYQVIMSIHYYINNAAFM